MNAPTQHPFVMNTLFLICNDCEQPTDWPYAVQHDPWGRATGDTYCEACAEKRYDRWQEKLMEST